MKKLLGPLLLSVLLFGNYQLLVSNVVVQLENQKQEKMKLLFGLLDFPESLNDFVAKVCKDLAGENQKKSGFSCQIKKFEKLPSKNLLKQYAHEGYTMIIFLKMKSPDTLEWRIYDSLQAQMYCGKKMILDSNALEFGAHSLADALWKILTGQEGIFSTRIAYCCEKIEAQHKGSDLYIQTPYLDNPECLLKGGKFLAPRWNKNKKNPLILISEVTPSNIRLVSCTMTGRKKIVSNFSGITMLSSFSGDGHNVAYCATHQSGTSQIFLCSIDKKNNKQVCTRVTHNTGNNTSPNLRDNGDIIFCSDFETKVPQIYYLHAADKRLERITHSGYCACPNYSEKNGTIAYLKMLDKNMQVFTCDLATKQHKQITFTPGNKDECCWSPCGNYIAYSVEIGTTSRIAIYNMITQEETFITAENRRCSYPSWA